MIHINVVCDTCETCVPAGFSSRKETFEDLIRALEQIGWKITQNEHTKFFGALCPEHKDQEAEGA